MEQKGIIEEYTTIVNPQKISGAVSCYFEIETTPKALPEVTEILKENDTITQIYRVTGKNKLHVHAVAASAEEMEALMREVIDPLPGVIDSSCNMILSRIKDIKGPAAVRGGTDSMEGKDRGLDGGVADAAGGISAGLLVDPGGRGI